jgi:hypothetical protein
MGTLELQERKMIDYSQSGEQAAILAGLGYAQMGEHLGGEPSLGDYTYEALPNEERLIWDIGAWDPKTFSNSRALIELGWKAVLFEPSPSPMLAQLVEYGYNERVTLVQAPVALQLGLMPLWITDDAVSTSSADEHERWKDTAKFRGKLLSPAITLEDIANRFGGAEFINFDAEGFSVELFLRAMDLGYRPRVICCEHDGRTAELLTRATAEGYVATLVNQTNVVLVQR